MASSAANTVSILARLDDNGVVSGLQRIKVSMDQIKGADGKLDWSGIKNGGSATKALGEGIADLGQSMTLGITVPLVAAGGADALYPPDWQSASYRAVLVKENGQWRIRSLTLVQVLTEE